MINFNTAKQRINLSLSLSGLASHDELLVKSLVRLLNYRTTHNWSFGSGAVDLQVIGENSPEWTDGKLLPNVLWVGNSDSSKQPLLHLPVHANEFELMLNALGSKIITQQAAAQKCWPPSISHDETFMLQRWPPSSMLGTPARIKLATLMTGRPVSINTLIMNSGLVANDCEMFCQTLDRAGMLQRNKISKESDRSDSHERSKSILRENPDVSLLSRIRRRLGI